MIGDNDNDEGDGKGGWGRGRQGFFISLSCSYVSICTKGKHTPATTRVMMDGSRQGENEWSQSMRVCCLFVALVVWSVRMNT